jgi:soluble lytic murein transglycosylase-like protein
MEHSMRVYLIAAAIIALAQPALAAKSSKKKPHQHHVSHFSHHHGYAAKRHYARASWRRAPAGYAMRRGYVRTSAFGESSFGSPFFPNWQQAWTFPGAQAAPYGEYAPRSRRAHAHDGALDAAIARHAAANGLPVELVHRVVKRESGYNPRATNRGALGLMQIKYQTARGMGYTGSPSGLMDPETNLTYATRYLAGAYRAAGGNQNRAVALYASGYYRRGAPRETRVASVTPWQGWMTPWQAQTQGEW